MTVPGDELLAEALEFSGSFELDPDLIERLRNLPILRTVRLDRCLAVDDEVVEMVAKVPRLRELDLAYTSITDKSLEHLAGHGRLKSLRLTWCTQITDAGLLHLRRIPLRTLDLAFTNITDAGLQNLHAVRSLEELNLSNCPRVTPRGLSRLPAGLKLILAE